MNVYSQPEKFGLTILHVLDDPEACYSFQLFVVWTDADGKLFYAEDSGCSCPEPFEDAGLADLTEITPAAYDTFCRELDTHPAEGPDKVKVKMSVSARLVST